MLPCNGCAYRRDIPGDCHSRCAFDWKQLPTDVPKTDSTRAIERGWFFFPFNFDPVWGPDECAARSEAQDQSKLAKANPLLDLLSMLR